MGWTNRRLGFLEKDRYKWRRRRMLVRFVIPASEIRRTTSKRHEIKSSDCQVR
ncbi:hypothetical protein [Planctomyces sp. SH-PL62]|uniref:hypothetical protein n=1 Tax=Planctomyces sp. SH-PL62 TaxID=1636152 RepID=UPI0012E86A71|nr:hypothetical protein [Planctomyces sp. SH-PL62]